MLTVQGKPFKKLKEDFIKLRSSFNYSQKQLKLARNSRDELSKELSASIRNNATLERKIVKLRELAIQNRLKNIRKVKEVTTLKDKEIAALTKQLAKKDSELAALRSSNRTIGKSKYARGLRVKELTDKLRTSQKEVKRLEKELDRLKSKEPKVQIKTVREKVLVEKVKKEPLPDKVRQLMSNNLLTQTKFDTLTLALVLEDFSIKTNLTNRQMIVLMEAYNLNYFNINQITLGTWTVLKELEYKNLIMGDRGGRKKAIGWFITSEGKRVAELLWERVRKNEFKRNYFK